MSSIQISCNLTNIYNMDQDTRDKVAREMLATSVFSKEKCDENRYIGTNDGYLKKDFSFFNHVPVEFFGTLFHV